MYFINKCTEDVSEQVCCNLGEGLYFMKLHNFVPPVFQGPAEEPTPQSLSSEEPANFSSESPSSHDQSHDLSGDLPEEHTKGPVDEEAPSSYQFNGKELDTIFATLPRKSRYKSGSYMSKSQVTIM